MKPRKINISDNSYGIIAIILFTIIAPNMDAISKILSQELPAIEIAFVRVTLQSLLLLPFILFKKGVKKIWPKNYFFHLLRGIFMSTWIVLIITAFKLMPLAEVIAIFFIEPLILTILAAIFLKEKITIYSILAILTGFIGALIVIQPSFISIGWFALLPLGAAFCFAIYLILTRIVSKTEEPVALQFYAVFVAMLILGFINLIGYSNIIFLKPIWPENYLWFYLIALGIIATIAHFLLVFAFKKAKTTILAPLQYLEIVGAAILGLLVFNEFPNKLQIFGILIIVISGLYIIWKDNKKIKNNSKV